MYNGKIEIISEKTTRPDRLINMRERDLYTTSLEYQIPIHLDVVIVHENELLMHVNLILRFPQVINVVHSWIYPYVFIAGVIAENCL